MVYPSASEETESNPKYVDRLLVQLKCDDHKKSSLPEADREASACELAVSRYDPENTLFGYRRGKRYDGTFPSALCPPFIQAFGGTVLRLLIKRSEARSKVAGQFFYRPGRPRSWHAVSFRRYR